MKKPKTPEQLQSEFNNCIKEEFKILSLSYLKLMQNCPDNIIKIMAKLEGSPLYEATFYSYVIKMLEQKVNICKTLEQQINEN